MNHNEDQLQNFFKKAEHQPSLMSAEETRKLVLGGKNGSPATSGLSRRLIPALSAIGLLVGIALMTSIDEEAPSEFKGDLVSSAVSFVAIAPQSDMSSMDESSNALDNHQVEVQPEEMIASVENDERKNQILPRPIIKRTESSDRGGYSIQVASLQQLPIEIENEEHEALGREALAEAARVDERQPYQYASITPIAIPDPSLVPNKVVVTRLNALSTSESDDYNPMVTADGRTLYFVSNRIHGLGGHDFWVTTKGERGDTVFAEPRNLGSDINTAANEGGASISADGQTMYYTVCDPDKPRMCDIYEAQLGENGWITVRSVDEINSPEWDAQPTVTADGKMLFFVSSRPGTLGGKDDADIYMTTKKADGRWATPRNLKAPINTEKMEDSPFILPGGDVLYFSSEGHRGNGGYDFFVSRIESDGSWGAPENLGEPFNTSKDERFIALPAAGDIVYYASSGNRKNGNQLDLYMAKVQSRKANAVINGSIVGKETNEKFRAHLVFVDAETGNIISGARTNGETREYSIIVGKSSVKRRINVFGVSDQVGEIRASFEIPPVEEYCEFQCDLTVHSSTSERVRDENSFLAPPLPMSVDKEAKILTLDVEESGLLSILDVYGNRLIETWTTADKAETVNLKDFPEGLYLVRLNEKTGVLGWKK